MVSSRMLRYVSLLVLTVQTSVHVLLLRYPRKQGPASLASTAVFLTEELKCLLCGFMLLHQTSYSLRHAAALFWQEVVLKPRETFKMSIPSALYTIQNNLLYVALTNLDAATYQADIYSHNIQTNK